MAQPRLLHTMLRVGDLDRALDFYTGTLGMTLLRRQDFPGDRFTLAFVGYGPERRSAVIELTHNWDTAAYEGGTAYGHIAIGVVDVRAFAAEAARRGAQVVRAPGPLKGDPGEVIAFLVHPDGYRIELIERGEDWLG
jgi:lactoylglutathione lyase